MKILIFFLFFYSSLFCQDFFIIRDSITFSPIEGVHLINEENKVSISDGNGKVIIKTDKEKSTMIISHIGYKSKVIICKKMIRDSLVVFLQPNSINLKEVIVKSNPKSFKYSLNDRRGINFNTGVSYPEKFQVGIYLPNNADDFNLKISSILFELVNKNVKESDSISFNVEIWNADSLLLPFQKLNTKEIVINQKFSKKIKVFLKDEEILFDEKGVFVIIDFLNKVSLGSKNIIKPKFKAVNVKKKLQLKEILRYRTQNNKEFSEWFEPIYSKKNKQILKLNIYFK
ncbi:hypothetical protein SY27_08545 [Flavobacterium sp. 316]|uniref:Carboxypeptidase-like regulatory domain-containing protein n=1 Tax=Flavobacterium sediminilitoris TaxID=2024526 RepID=A0ABY4HNQ4_9FLAO|nr:MULTISPECIES: hypothetical protein [Flavobacterium]KIX21720.1 hypothetical protein SY27_08545 [Flavobacterium sp. 316]UOX34497.1 hypothetical protein LXD69_03055 [Flavobacterium sediminilitoris]